MENASCFSCRSGHLDLVMNESKIVHNNKLFFKYISILFYFGYFKHFDRVEFQVLRSCFLQIPLVYPARHEPLEHSWDFYKYKGHVTPEVTANLCLHSFIKSNLVTPACLWALLFTEALAMRCFAAGGRRLMFLRNIEVKGIMAHTCFLHRRPASVRRVFQTLDAHLACFRGLLIPHCWFDCNECDWFSDLYSSQLALWVLL